MNASHQPISFLDARRRVEAEAAEIAFRPVHRRDVDLGMLETRRFRPDECCPANGAGLSYCPDCGHRVWDDTGIFITCTCARPSAVPVHPLSVVRLMALFWAGALLGALVALALALLIGWAAGQVDGQAVQDFVSPTAAQARDTGWVALSEGL